MGIAIKLLLGLAGVTRGETSPTYHLDFDGTGDYVSVAASASLNDLPLGDFTVEMSAFFDAPLVSTPILASKYNGDGTAGWSIYNSTSGGVLGFSVPYGDNFEFQTARQTLWAEYTQAHHFAFVYTAAPRTMRIYIDGVEAVYSAEQDDVGGVYQTEAAEPLTIFADAFGSDNKGNLYWFRVSNTARYASNFTPPSLLVAPADDANTALLLALDEGTGNPADSSGNGNAVTNSGATWVMD